MSRSNRTSRSSTSTGTSSKVHATPARSSSRRNDGGARKRTIGPRVDSPVTRSRRLQHYTFRFNRSDSRTEGCNSVQIVSNDGTAQQLTLAEARSLYNFLAGQFAGV